LFDGFIPNYDNDTNPLAKTGYDDVGSFAAPIVSLELLLETIPKVESVIGVSALSIITILGKSLASGLHSVKVPLNASFKSKPTFPAILMMLNLWRRLTMMVVVCLMVLSLIMTMTPIL
jgi:hypothetical protein